MLKLRHLTRVTARRTLRQIVARGSWRISCALPVTRSRPVVM